MSATIVSRISLNKNNTVVPPIAAGVSSAPRSELMTFLTRNLLSTGLFLAAAMSMCYYMYMLTYIDIDHDHSHWRAFCKAGPVVLVSLSLFVRRFSVRALTMATGCLFGAFGDVALVYEGVPPFLAGMVFFALSHIFYAISLSLPDVDQKSPSFSPLKSLYSFLLWPFAITQFLMLIENITLRYCVLGYMVIISAMIWRAITRGRTMSLVGSLVFASSDMTLAWRMFGNCPMPNVVGALFVMGTYYVAQLMLVGDAALETDAKPNSKEHHKLH